MTLWSLFVPQLTAGLVAAMGFWLKALGDRRNRAKQYEAALARAKAETDVIAAWVQAYRLVGDDGNVRLANGRVEHELASVYTRVRDARADFERTRSRAYPEVSPHYALAAVALIAFFIPTGAVAVVHALKTRQALRMGEVEAARRHSHRTVVWFWVSAACFVVLFFLALV